MTDIPNESREAREQFLGELKAFLKKWDAEIIGNVSLYGGISLWYCARDGEYEYFDGFLPHCINAETKLEEQQKKGGTHV